MVLVLALGAAACTLPAPGLVSGPQTPWRPPGNGFDSGPGGPFPDAMLARRHDRLLRDWHVDYDCWHCHEGVVSQPERNR
jgi:hypothetical protein